MKKVLAGTTYYDVPELSTVLDVTPYSIRKFIQEGRMEAIKIGRRLWISEEALKQFLAQAKVSPKDGEN